jgi:hypothetical protein
MRVGHFEIRCGVCWEIWDGRTLKYRLATFDEALQLADDLLEEDRRREEIAQYGDGRDGNIADTRWNLRNEEAV